MRPDKFTQKTQEALLEAQSQAEAYNHAQIEPEHLLLALLQQADGVAPQIVQGLGRNPGQLAAQVEADLNRRPKVYGTATQIGASQALQAAGGAQDHAGAERRRAGAAGRTRLRSGLRRAAAEAGNPAVGAGPAGASPAAQRFRRGRHGRGRCGRWPDRFPAAGGGRDCGWGVQGAVEPESDTRNGKPKVVWTLGLPFVPATLSWIVRRVWQPRLLPDT